VRTRLLSLLALACAATVALPAQPSHAATAASSARSYYVSLGDSYSVGYQPNVGATPGYAAYVAARTHLTLANFGCGGATTDSILTRVGCPIVLPGTAGLQTYPDTTQIAAAGAFIKAHRGHIGLITVSIGGNDMIACVGKTDNYGCVTSAAKTITSNVTKLAFLLRAVAGKNVPIIGLTYPEIFLGAWVWPTHPPTANTIGLIKLSVTEFKLLVNPALLASYATASASFVDVTAASGGYGSLTNTVKTKSYGKIPVPVATVCSLTWTCNRGDVHATTKGYNLIGQLTVARYQSLTKG
jgi:lysophospholipase L1-like esterase